MSTRSRWFVASAVAVAGLTLAAVPSSAEVTTDPADAAAGWLGRQFVGGDHLETSFDGQSFPDTGLTIDGVFALTAAGVGGTTTEAAMGYLAGAAGSYVGDGDTESYAGALAKLALAAQVRGEDPTAFAGIDLIARLEARQSESGRFSDASGFGDFTNGITQSLAVLALHRAGAPSTTAGATYLAGEQCPDGGFPQALEADVCTSSIDVTALAVQALLAVGDTAAAGDGVAYLEAVQGGDGGFGNANSTGLAGAALASSGSAAAADAVGFLVGLQQGCGAAGADRGAIAFDGSGFDGRAARATTQAILGLTGADLATLSVSGSEVAGLPELDCPVPTTTTPTTTGPTTPTTATSGGGLPATPPSGAPLTTLSRTSVPAGGSISVSEPGFVPGEDVRIGLWSDPVLLATVKADAEGKVNATVAIPASTPAGSHTLALLGSATTKVASITVTGSSTAAQALPRTGSATTVEAVVGVTAVGGGAALVLVARRRRAAAA